ncbi:hypothetical protein NKDENANG_00369 [Candidatus Entotheonellaceae bacterium PAL068K]
MFGSTGSCKRLNDVLTFAMEPEQATNLSAVNRDGNEIPGIRLPDLVLPLGTHSNWNLRAPETGRFSTQTPALAPAAMPHSRRIATARTIRRYGKETSTRSCSAT